MKRNLFVFGGTLAFAVFLLIAITLVAAIREVGATVRETLPDVAHTYLLVEGLPEEPASTVIQYSVLDEDDKRISPIMWLFILFAVTVTFGMLGYLVIGPEGISGVIRQSRLLKMRMARGADGRREQPRPDDEWMRQAYQQQAAPAAPALPPPSTPWLLPAVTAREGEDGAR